MSSLTGPFLDDPVPYRDHWYVKSRGSYSCCYDGKVYARAQPGNIHAIYGKDQLLSKDWQRTKLFSDPYLELLMFQLPDRADRLGQPLESVLTTTLPRKGDSRTSAALIGTFDSKSVTGGTDRVYASTRRGSILLTKTECVFDKRIVCRTMFRKHKAMRGIYWPTLIERAWFCNPQGSLVRGEARGKLSKVVVAIERYQVTKLQERASEESLQVELPPGAFVQDYRYHGESTTNPASYFNPVTPERIRKSYATRAKPSSVTLKWSTTMYRIGIVALLALLILLARRLWCGRQPTPTNTA